MNLVCPHCAKVVDILPEMAGKTTTCPSCSGPFTVPLVPPEMLTAMGPSKENKDEAKMDPLAKPEEKLDTASIKNPTDSAPKELPALTQGTPPPAAVTGPSSPPHSGFRLVIAMSPNALPFIAPACLVLLLILLFLPWVGVYAGLTTLAEQTGFGVTFGGLTVHEKLETQLEVGWSGYMFIHFLCLLFGLLAMLGVLMAKYAPPNLRAKLKQFGPILVEQRPLIIGVFALLAFLCLFMLLFVNFPLEKEATGKRAKDLQKEGMRIKFGMIPEKLETDLLETQWLRRSPIYAIALVLSLLGFLGAFADWLRSRNRNRTMPHLEIVWGGNSL
jgi:hypothetical protein